MDLKAGVFKLLDATKDLSTMSARTVRTQLESQLGLEANALDSRKNEITNHINEYLKTHDDSDSSEASSTEEDTGHKKSAPSKPTSGKPVAPAKKDGKTVPVAGAKRRARSDSESESDSDSSSAAGSSSDEEDGGNSVASLKKKLTPKKQKTGKDEAKPKDVAKPVLQVITKTGHEAPKQVAKLQGRAMSSEQFMRDAPNMELEIFGNRVSGAPRSFSSNNKGWYAGGKIQVQVGKKLVWAQLGVNCSIIGSKDWQ